MDTQTEHLFSEAIKLLPNQRAELVDAILSSILTSAETDQGKTIDPTIGQAWGDEVQRRMADVKAGRVAMIPHDQALPGAVSDV